MPTGRRRRRCTAKLTSDIRVDSRNNGQWRRHGLLHAHQSSAGGGQWVIGYIYVFFYAADSDTLTPVSRHTHKARKAGERRAEMEWNLLHRSTCIGMITATTCAGALVVRVRCQIECLGGSDQLYCTHGKEH